MDVIYTTLIVHGYKTYSQVPDVLKAQVKADLEALGLGWMASDNPVPPEDPTNP